MQNKSRQSSDPAARKFDLINKYNVTAKGYDDLYGEEQYEKYRLARRVLGERMGIVCDIGAGTLLFKEYLDKEGFTYHYYAAIDLSPGMLMEGRKRVDHRTDLVQADAAHLPIRDKACETAVSFTVIDLVPEQTLFLSECRRILRPTARCIISSLKKAQKYRRTILRIGRGLGETSHDYIYILEAS